MNGKCFDISITKLKTQLCNSMSEHITYLSLISPKEVINHLNHKLTDGTVSII